jgi:hypothetical protein
MRSAAAVARCGVNLNLQNAGSIATTFIVNVQNVNVLVTHLATTRHLFLDICTTLSEQSLKSDFVSRFSRLNARFAEKRGGANPFGVRNARFVKSLNR